MAVAELELIAAEVSGCQKCPLAKGRIKAVPGEGPADAQVMLIGEGPGFHENQQGRPFVGPAGQFLGELLRVAGLKREDVFITNVVKCRPPANRDPQPDEIAACSDYLARQTALIRPRVIVTLGRYSMARFLPTARISVVHGRPHTVGGVTVFPMYHPAAALHQPTLRQTLLDDMAKLPGILAAMEQKAPERAPVVAEPPPEPPKQLSLF